MESHEVHFTLYSIVATTRGQWHFETQAGWSHIDKSLVVLGAGGCSHRYRHDPIFGSSILTVCLLPAAIDSQLLLFERRVIPAARLNRLVESAKQASTDDEFDSVVFTMFSEASLMSGSDARSKAAPLRMQRAKRFIELHAFEPLRLVDIAKELGLSPFTTVRQFRAYTGRTPHAYLLEIRLERAKQMLKESCVSIEAIAKTVGFDDLAYFSRFFKQRTGYSPSSYRAA